jgi:hypothetical protein
LKNKIRKIVVASALLPNTLSLNDSVRQIVRDVFLQHIPSSQKPTATGHTADKYNASELFGWFVLATLHHGRFLSMISPSLSGGIGAVSEPFLTAIGIKNSSHISARVKKNRIQTFSSPAATNGHAASTAIQGDKQLILGSEHEVVDGRAEGESIDMADGFLTLGK